MRIGVVCDGQVESQALKIFLDRGGFDFCTKWQVLYADMQPKASPGQIAKSAEAKIKILIEKNFDRIIVIIDREDRLDCCPEFSQQIKNGLSRLGYSHIDVVVKNRKFENWLISDPRGIRAKMQSRFNVTDGLMNSVIPDKGDQVADAEEWLNRASIKKPYQKRKDGVSIAYIIDCAELERNSRSFRRFLRVSGHPSYGEQSRRYTEKA